jgi:hypothetical protein
MLADGSFARAEISTVAVVAMIGLGEPAPRFAARGVGRCSGRPRRALRREERGQVGHVTLAQRRRDRRHLRIRAALVAIEQELPVQVRRDLACERRHCRIGRVAVRAVAGDAGRRFAAAGLDVGGERCIRQGDQGRDQEWEKSARTSCRQCAEEDPNAAGDQS